MNSLDQFLLLRPLVKLVSGGKFFRTVFPWFLRVIAVLKLLGFLFISYKMWSMLSYGSTGSMILFFLVTQIVLLALVYIVITILLVRAKDIESLPDTSDYVMIPIFVIFTRMSGEIICAFYALIGIVAATSIWLMGGMARVIPGMGLFAGANGFLGGVVALIACPVIGFLILSLFYLVAEQMGVLMDIARNTRK